jgi:hypothetical protein
MKEFDMNRAQRRSLNAAIRRETGGRCGLHTEPIDWSRDDAAWFKANPTRSHRVRSRFPNEWFVARGDEPSLDMVAVQQAEPGIRIRSPFTLPPSPCREWLRQAAATEAGAHVLFDMALGGETEVSSAALEVRIASYARSGSA